MLTGFPGFIAGRMLAALEGRAVVALVLPSMRAAAERAREALPPGCRPRLVEGDLTRDGLGLSAADRASLEGVRHVWHLAAVYDLGVGEALARAVNVDGTRRVLALCAELSLERLLYFSTCYVAGDRRGRILESELDAGQGFRNHYERTKFEAEVLVRDAGLPTTTVRPAIVVGDSRTGETAKYDGPYFALAHLARLERAGRLGRARWLPQIGPGTAPLNLVPVDHIVAASVALAFDAAAAGATVQLADPEALGSGALVTAMRAAFGLGPSRWRVPGWLGRLTLALPGARGMTGMPRELADYLDLPQEFDTREARRLLEPHGVVCPRLLEYLPTLVAAVRASPDGPSR